MQIQGKYRCINCFNELNKENEICNCGYDRAQYKLKTHWLHPGTILDNRYYVGRVIGEGGFGITYIGYDSNLSIKIAIKEFFLSGINSRNSTVSNELDTGLDDQEAMFENYREKFINEARILAKFNDQQEIVTVFNFFKGNNTAYIIMEFLDGETLKEYLKRKKQLSVDETLEIFLPIMETLDKVHATKLIHRDISPDNIIFTKDGKAKLLDFGAAREVADNNKSLSVVLKHGYAPPEQYQTHGNQGPWTDVYALSATIYKCLTGKTPIEAMDRTLGEELEPVCVITSDCPQIISDVVMKGLEIKWADRYQTMSEMATELKNAWNTENVIVQSHKKDELENTLLVFDDKRLDVIVDETNSSQEDSIFDETLEDQIDLDEIDSDENDFDDNVTIEPAVEDKLPVKSKNIVETSKYQSKSDNKPFIWLVAAIAFCVILGLIITITVNSKNKSAIFDKLIDVSGEKSFSYLIDANVGDIVEFGNYNGYTKWRVLNKDGNKLLLITEEIIDKKAYSTQNGECDWSTSSLRTWLNNDYYIEAFSDEEKELIADTDVDGVTDKVYLLSKSDADNYFSNDSNRIAEYLGIATCWWLRAPVYGDGNKYSSSSVGDDGFIGYSHVDYVNFGVRPVINIDLSTLTDEIDNENILSEIDVTSEQTNDTKEVKNIVDANVGDIVEFGNYNGLTEWRVLKNEHETLMLIAEDVLECRAYNEENKKCDWSNCTLREWLNNNFYNSTFSDKEKALLIESDVDGGKDKVFLLSYDEAQSVFQDDSDRVAYIRDEEKGQQDASWWLRSPVRNYDRSYFAARVNIVGLLGYYDDIESDSTGVRPVINVDISNMDETAILNKDMIEEKGTDNNVPDNNENSEIQYSFLKSSQVGDIIEFGDYNGYTNWRVLKKDGDKLLLITEEIIEKKPFNNKNKNCNWSTCSLRTWLNIDYYEKAFTDKEKSLIANIDVDGVNDKVYLLSKEEADSLFNDNNDREAKYGKEISRWWRRSPVINKRDIYYAGSVGIDGNLDDYNFVNNYSDGGVRPVINIDLSNL